MAKAHPFDQLSPDLVMDAVESVGLRCDARILELNSYENRVYQIGIEDEAPVIGKFYRPERWSDEQILEEHALTLELWEQDISAVPPLWLTTTPVKTTLAHHEGFRFALYPRQGGRAPNLDDLENLEILGRTLGRVHLVGAAEPFISRPSISVADYGQASREYLLGAGFIPPDFEASYRNVTDQLIESMMGLLDDVGQIRVHGDCHIGNILWRDEVPHFVDFDDARMGPAIQDLWMMLSGDQTEAGQQIRAIVRGYSDFRDFDASELRLIEPLRTLRMMYHAAWLARRWDDPAFPRAFPFFNTNHYWAGHIQQLIDQTDRLAADPLTLY